MSCPRSSTWIYTSPLPAMRFGWLDKAGWGTDEITKLRQHALRQDPDMTKCPVISLVEEPLLGATLEAGWHLVQRRRIVLDVIAVLTTPQLEATLNALRRGASDVLFADSDRIVVIEALERAKIRLFERMGTGTVLSSAPRQLAELQTLKASRNRLFPAFATDDAAWDILVYVVEQHLRGRPAPVGSACLSAPISTTAALRKVDLLVESGLVQRKADPESKRRVLLVPTEALLGTFEDFRCALAGWSPNCLDCPRFTGYHPETETSDLVRPSKAA